MSSDRQFDIGVLFYGNRFRTLIRTIACMEPFLSMPFGSAWAGAAKAAMNHLDGEANTPLWFWRP